MTTEKILHPTIIISLAMLSLLFPKSIFADTTSNDNYSIDVNDIDTNPQPSPFKPQVLGTQEIKSEFTTGKNYTVNASSDSLSFQLSQRTIDLGILSATNPVIRTSDIIFSNPAAGAQVIGYENHPLISYENGIIPDTSCDNGVCTQTIGSPWQSTLTYGFGYRCDNANSSVCDKQFSDDANFKQFPDDSRNEPAQPVIFTDQTQSATKATITYKVNISGTQKTGGYYNSITYLAIPNF